MSLAVEFVMETIAAGGPCADGLTGAICRLVTKGGELGELEVVEVRDAEGKLLRSYKVPPLRWFERLGDAIDAGALEPPTQKRIRNVVDRILAEGAA